MVDAETFQKRMIRHVLHKGEEDFTLPDDLDTFTAAFLTTCLLGPYHIPRNAVCTPGR